jgi:hypothetical protein
VNRKVAAALTGTALVALTATGCGGDDNGKKLDAWAKSVCDSVRTPYDTAQAALRDMGRVVPGEKPADLQKRLSQDMSTAAASYDKLANAVNGAGAPPVDNGGDLAKQATRDLKGSASSYQDLKKKVDALDTKDQAKFASGLRDLGNDTQVLGKTSSTGLSKLQRGDLGKAIAKQPGCQPGTASGSPSSGASAPSSPSSSLKG